MSRARNATVLVAVLFLSGCTAVGTTTKPQPSLSPTPATTQDSGSSAPRALIDREGVDVEYAAASARLEASLPPGGSLPTELQGDYDPDGRFEQGFGGLVAGTLWQCAWVDEYERARTAADTVRAERALDTLAGWTSLPEIAPLLDEESAAVWEARVIGPARSGDDESLLAIADQC